MVFLKAFVRQHPVVTYFVMTFAISWGGVLLTLGSPTAGAGVKAQDNPLFPLSVVAMVLGPSATGLLLTAFLQGRQGLRDFRARLFKWRAPAPLYVVALFAAPLVSLAVTLTLSIFSREFLPLVFVANDKTAVVALGLVVAAVAGFFEELGWTGFAIPQLKRHHGVVATGLAVGLLWSAWHVLVVAWGIGDRAGTLPIAVFMIVDGVGSLPAFRVLMVWVYDRTESLFVGILMHVSITATVLILTPLTTGVSLLAYGVAFSGVTWIVVAALTVAGRGQPSKQPLRRQAA